MSYYNREIAVFDANLSSWMDAGHEGKWVVIKHEEVVGIYNSDSDAYKAAVERFGTGAEFLLRRIKRTRPTLLAPIMTFRAETC